MRGEREERREERGRRKEEEGENDERKEVLVLPTLIGPQTQGGLAAHQEEQLDDIILISCVCVCVDVSAVCPVFSFCT